MIDLTLRERVRATIARASKKKHRRDRGLWSHEGVPHKGWSYVDVFDLGPEERQTCEMCLAADVRYVHVVEHDDYPDELAVGCICAGHMTCDLVGARRRETNLRNRAKRRAHWTARKGWTVTERGNLTIKVDGYRFTVFQRGTQWCWRIKRGERKVFSEQTYTTPDEAALAAFDAFEAA